MSRLLSLGSHSTSSTTAATLDLVSPAPAATQYTIHVGAGMTDAQGHMMDMEEGMLFSFTTS